MELDEHSEERISGPDEVRKEIKAFLKIHQEAKNLADNLLIRIRNIQSLCKKKNFKGALKVLDSRFWTYRYLRKLLEQGKKLEANWQKLSKEWNTLSLDTQHRFLWYHTHIAHLARDEERIKIFGLDVIKELSSNQSVEENLKALKENYNPATETKLTRALDKIKEELINLDRFAQEAITILEKEMVEIDARMKKIQVQSHSLDPLPLDPLLAKAEFLGVKGNWKEAVKKYEEYAYGSRYDVHSTGAYRDRVWRYMHVAQRLESQGRIAEAKEFWESAAGYTEGAHLIEQLAPAALRKAGWSEHEVQKRVAQLLSFSNYLDKMKAARIYERIGEKELAEKIRASLSRKGK